MPLVVELKNEDDAPATPPLECCEEKVAEAEGM